MPLWDQRCSNHPGREAVARCPECRRSFCRECITEHGERVLCASCLNKLLRPTATSRRRLTRARELIPLLLGLLTAWLFFYWLGEGLLAIPSSFHEGTLWQSTLPPTR